MRYLLTLLFFAITFLNTCFSASKESTAEIIGTVTGIPAKIVYLKTAADGRIIDSTNCVNSHFVFKTKYNESEKNIDVSIAFKDSISGSVKFLTYKNTHHPKCGSLFFMLEKDPIKISGSYNPDNNTDVESYLNIEFGKDNHIKYKTMFLYFFDLPGFTVSRETKIDMMKDLVKENGDSQYLLSLIYEHRSMYTKQELKHFFSSFSVNIKGSSTSDFYKQYVELLPNPDSAHKNYHLVNDQDKMVDLINHKSELTLLVFWASWCGPCRLEIPLIKKIYSEFGSKGLRIISISIDKNKDQWKLALKEERMPWVQTIAEPEIQFNIMSSYNFSAIPSTILIDQEGKELQRIVGFNERDQKRLSEYLNQHLH